MTQFENIKTAKKLTEEQKDLLLGTLLGDGNLDSQNYGRTFWYRALHSENQYDYILHKYNVLKDLIQMKLARDSKHKRYYFNTLVDGSLRYYGNLFYTYNPQTEKFVKEVPKNIEQLLTPRALAYLHMDDGALKWINHSNAMRLCTEGFSETSVIRLKKAIDKLCGIETGLNAKKLSNSTVGFRISIPEKHSTAYRLTIQSFLLPSMAYKVSDGKKGALVISHSNN